MADQSSMLMVERDRTRDAAVTCLSHSLSGQRNMSLWNRAGRKLCSCLELTQALPPQDHPGS